jgi:ribose-phosphate pyrophosphokinase
MGQMIVIAGDAHPDLARALAAMAGKRLVQAAVTAFADGETRLVIDAELRHAHVCIVQPTCTPVNDRFMALVLMADAACAEGAASVTAVMPYFGYARQDVRGRRGEPRSAQLAARLLRCAGVSRAVVLELHSPALESAFEMPLIHLQADELFVPVIRSWRLENPCIVSPDAGGLKRAQRMATALAVPLAAVAKTRPQADQAAASLTLGDVRGRRCVIVDDMASTGGTIAEAARALLQGGATEVHAAVVHAVMAPGALERILAAGVQRIAATDSVAPIRDARIQAVPAAPLLARFL